MSSTALPTPTLTLDHQMHSKVLWESLSKQPLLCSLEMEYIVFGAEMSLIQYRQPKLQELICMEHILS